MPRKAGRSRDPKQRVENVAANVVHAQLGSDLGQPLTACQWDDGSADGMHDFYVTGDDVRIALEITTLADGDRVGRNVRWDREGPTDSAWLPIEGLDGVWLVAPDDDAEASTVLPALHAHMPNLSRSDVGPGMIDTRRWYDYAQSPPAVQRAQGTQELRALNAARITFVSRIPDPSDELLAKHNGEVQIGRGFETFRKPDRNHPVRVIDEHLAGKYRSDVDKLGRALDATARHLWFWLEFQEELPLRTSFEREGLPDADPSTAGIDGLWLALEKQPGPISGWYWVRDRGWGEFNCERDDDVPLCQPQRAPEAADSDG